MVLPGLRWHGQTRSAGAGAQVAGKVRGEVSAAPELLELGVAGRLSGAGEGPGWPPEQGIRWHQIEVRTSMDYRVQASLPSGCLPETYFKGGTSVGWQHRSSL